MRCHSPSLKRAAPTPAKLNQLEKETNMPLTEKQKRFVAEYLIDLNATQAAIRAGYSKRSAEVTGHRMLRNAKVQEAIQKGQNKLADRHEITKDRIAAELSKIAFSDLRKAAQWNADGVVLVASDDLDDDTAAAIAEVVSGKDGPRVKLYNKQGALMDLAKLYGFVTDKQEISGVDGSAIETITRIEIVAPKFGDGSFDDGECKD